MLSRIDAGGCWLLNEADIVARKIAKVQSVSCLSHCRDALYMAAVWIIERLQCMSIRMHLHQHFRCQ